MNENAINYVAEMSANHNGSLERAVELVNAIARAGASSLKLQTYTPETMTLRLNKGEFLVSKSNKLWGGKSLYDLYSQAQTPWEWHNELFQVARDFGLIPFSSPFDKSAVDFLEKLDCPMYKIASFEVVDTELISYAASTGKPLVMSTGMASIKEIAIAVEAARTSGAEDITLLKTTSAYPASPRDSNLATMTKLGEIFKTKIGVSDHTMGLGVSVAAAALGASMIEKHVTLRRVDGGVDGSFSMEPSEFAQLIVEAESARQSIGKVHFGPSEGDLESLQFRRSLYVSRDVLAGEEVDEENVRSVRPSGGLSVSEFKNIIGLRFAVNAKAGTPMSFDLLKA
jgi:pseudaminic acid synthase